jgi:hypothetical protein
MAVMTDVLVPALKDAREAHIAVSERFRSDATVTPPGPYRQMLDLQVTDVQDHLRRIEHHVRELRPPAVLDDTLDMARWVARSAVLATMLPLTIGSMFVTGLLRGQRPADARLLRNAEDEYALAARALAACRAGESIAEQVHDQATADLLASLRRHDEELLKTLEDSVTQQARAVAAAANGHRPTQTTGGLADAAAQAVRATLDRLREAARIGGRRTKGAAEGVVRELPDATRMTEEVQGMVTREQDLPIAGFSQLSITDIHKRLRTLSQTELTVIEGYERSHANRPGVLNAIERLRGTEPWTGYDTMNPDQITAHLHNDPSSVARHALEYERSHRQRETVITIAEARAAV